ncbi:MAG: hypothetical protein QOD99_1305 [Chthoniobacter sp.]|jgi:hypothetical protein|nr:hypothetical protein [Chthoniobacter sp.]
MTPTTIRRKYVTEAAALLALMRLAVRFLPASWVFRWARRQPQRIERFRRNEIEWISWAIETAGNSRWMETPYLPRALAAQAMLRRRGVIGHLCLGVSDEKNVVFAHAWVEVEGKMIVGGANARGFTKVAEF